jgi:hypothetical protein
LPAFAGVAGVVVAGVELLLELLELLLLLLPQPATPSDATANPTINCLESIEEPPPLLVHQFPDVRRDPLPAPAICFTAALSGG